MVTFQKKMKCERKTKKKSLNRRAHAVGACKSCRKRHVRCDQARPICKACKDSDLRCDGVVYSEIYWVGSSFTDSDCATAESSSGPNVRRHLYTVEKEREIMSSALVDQLAPFTVDDFLMKIDNTSRDIEDQTSGRISIGPFGILNFMGDKPATTSNTPEGPSGDVHNESALEIDTTDGNPNSMGAPFAEVSSAEEMLGGLDSFLQWADIFNLDPPPVGWNLAPATSELGEYGANLTPPSSAEFPLLQPQLEQFQNGMLQGNLDDRDILEEGHLLLRHFNEHVVTRIIWLPMTQKSPWMILNIPNAMITLDQITYMNQNTIKHACRANLYGILACAAFHLSANPHIIPDRPDQYWNQLSTAAYERGKAELNKTLELELGGPQKAKYKEQLMAMLSLTTFAIISNNQRESRCHLVNMEYLIRLRGLVKPRISRRARLLHYMYTWIRILTESTLVLHHEIAHTAPSKALWSRRLGLEELTRLSRRRASVSTNEQDRVLDDFLRVPINETDSDLNIDDPKDLQTNLGDIHLVDSRNVAEEMHTLVNGVPETWLGLLSQTTRLANVLDMVNTGNYKVTTERHLDLQRRSSQLENMICSYASQKLPSAYGGPKAHIMRALDHALMIFFYRRVRKVNPCILQGYVKSIIQELDNWDIELEKHSLAGPGTAWPAFMAGCEAAADEDRQSILYWLKKANTQSGFTSYLLAATFMEEVWKIRDSDSSGGAARSFPTVFSWTDYSKQNLQWLLLF